MKVITAQPVDPKDMSPVQAQEEFEKILMALMSRYSHALIGKTEKIEVEELMYRFAAAFIEALRQMRVSQTHMPQDIENIMTDTLNAFAKAGMVLDSPASRDILVRKDEVHKEFMDNKRKSATKH